MFLATIHFPGNCNQAISFYKEVLGAQVKDIAYGKDAPQTPETAAMAMPPDFVMHSFILIDNTLVAMTDGCENKPSSPNYSFMLMKDTVAEVEALFTKLGEGGKVVAPLGPVFWADMYGMVEDQFGVTWQIMTNNQ